jgi:hypothetical protein
MEAFDALQGINAAANTVALARAASGLTLHMETVSHRHSVLSDLHELPSIAHVIDMHQLTSHPTVKHCAGTVASKDNNLHE